MVTAADSVTPDASFTSPLLAINEHRGYWVENMRRLAMSDNLNLKKYGARGGRKRERTVSQVPVDCFLCEFKEMI